jgi:hypothetical protein
MATPKSWGGTIWYLRVHLLLSVNAVGRCEDVVQKHKNVAFPVKSKVRPGRGTQRVEVTQGLPELASKVALPLPSPFPA